MAETRELQNETRPRLPVPISITTFTAGDQKYEKFTYEKGKGPTLAQAIEITNQRSREKGTLREMLSYNEAMKINNNESIMTFSGNLKPGESTYVRHQWSEWSDLAAVLYRNGDGGFSVEKYDDPDDVSRVLILKVYNSEVAQMLRIEEGQTVVLKSPNGEETRITVPNGTTVTVEAPN